MQPGGLTDEEQLEYHALMEAEYGGEGLADFITRIAPREPPPDHIRRYLIPHLEEAARKPKRLIVCMPPRHAKSYTIMRAMVWQLLRTPAALNAYISYGGALSNDQSRFMRNLARETSLDFAPDAQGVQRWFTKQGGGLIATGVNGTGITGKGIKGWMVIDDPHGDRRQAESSRYRANVWEQFRGTLLNRLEENSSIIIVQTRWHVEDLVGHILNGELEDGEEWDLVEMPALADIITDEAADDDCPDERLRALWAEKYNVEKLKKLRKGSGPNNWWSIYQQKPRRRGGAIFHAPSYYDFGAFKLDGHRMRIGGDPAATKKTASDWSVAVCLAVKNWGEETEAWIRAVTREQVSVPQYTRTLRELAKKWKARVSVEAVAGFKAVPQTLRELAPKLRVTEAPVRGDKYTRAQLVAAAWNQGRVHVPIYDEEDPDPQKAAQNKALNELIDAFVAVVEAFTGLDDAHDDDVDALAHAFNAEYKEFKPQGPSIGEVAW